MNVQEGISRWNLNWIWTTDFDNDTMYNSDTKSYPPYPFCDGEMGMLGLKPVTIRGKGIYSQIQEGRSYEKLTYKTLKTATSDFLYKRYVESDKPFIVQYPADDYPKFDDEKFKAFVSQDGVSFSGGIEAVKRMTDRMTKLGIL
jgi:hypothetical protein